MSLNYFHTTYSHCPHCKKPLYIPPHQNINIHINDATFTPYTIHPHESLCPHCYTYIEDHLENINNHVCKFVILPGLEYTIHPTNGNNTGTSNNPKPSSNVHNNTVSYITQHIYNNKLVSSTLTPDHFEQSHMNDINSTVGDMIPSFTSLSASSSPFTSPSTSMFRLPAVRLDERTMQSTIQKHNNNLTAHKQRLLRTLLQSTSLHSFHSSYIPTHLSIKHKYSHLHKNHPLTLNTPIYTPSLPTDNALDVPILPKQMAAIPLTQRFTLPPNLKNMLITQYLVEDRMKELQEIQRIQRQQSEKKKKASPTSSPPPPTNDTVTSTSTQQRELSAAPSPTSWSSSSPSSAVSSRAHRSGLGVSNKLAVLADMCVSQLCSYYGALHLQTTVRQLLIQIFAYEDIHEYLSEINGIGIAAVAFKHIVELSHKYKLQQQQQRQIEQQQEEEDQPESKSTSRGLPPLPPIPTEFLPLTQLTDDIELFMSAEHKDTITLDIIERHYEILQSILNKIRDAIIQRHIPTTSIENSDIMMNTGSNGMTDGMMDSDVISAANNATTGIIDNSTMLSSASSTVVDALRAHLERYSEDLLLDPDTKRLAAQIGNAAVKYNLCVKRTSASLCAACVYLAIQLQDFKVTQYDFCKRCNITEVTLRKTFRQLIENDWHILLPEDYIPIHVPAQLDRAAQNANDKRKALERDAADLARMNVAKYHVQRGSHSTHRGTQSSLYNLRALNKMYGSNDDSRSYMDVLTYELPDNMLHVPTPQYGQNAYIPTPQEFISTRINDEGEAGSSAGIMYTGDGRTSMTLEYPPLVLSSLHDGSQQIKPYLRF